VLGEAAAWPELPADEGHAAVAEAAARITAAVFDPAPPAVSGSVTVLRHRATFDATAAEAMSVRSAEPCCP
jgi:hypothetical protein